ncbi:Pentatricopeptide repeat-containing protein At2g26790, mitochondrial [Linum perenne]
MKAFCKLGDVDAATALLTEMKKKGMIPDFVNYTTLIHGYCCGGKLNEALKLFKEMKDNGIKPDIITYNVLASGFSRSGHTEEIKRLLDYMMDQGIEPRNDTYSVIIEGLCTAGKLKDAEAFFFDVKDQSPDICNAMVNGYCSVKSVEKAFKLVKQGYTLKKSSCWKLLSSLENDSEKSVQLAEMMLARNADYSCTLCSKVIGTLSCAGEMEKAGNLFHLLSKVGISVDLLTYTMMIHGYCKVNRLKEAIDLLDDMKKRRVKPDVITYTVLLDGALKKLPGRREQESVKNAIAYEMKEMEIEPDVGHYTVLIDRDCRTDNLQGAKELFKEMIDRGLQPDNVVYTALLCGHLNVGDRVGARVLLGEMYDKKLTRDAILDSALIQHGLLKVTKLQFR